VVLVAVMVGHKTALQRMHSAALAAIGAKLLMRKSQVFDLSV